MKRYCIFAHYDKEGRIADYVFYYLLELKKVCNHITFFSDGSLDEIQKKKLYGFVDNIISERHGEYDFGSYKRGFFSIQDRITEEDELLLCNDSCFGPLYSFDKIFNKMDLETCDMWGIIFSDPNNVFLMSFFLLLKPTIFTKTYFIEFLKSIKPEKRKEDIVSKYEERFSILAKSNDAILKSYITFDKDEETILYGTQYRAYNVYSDNISRLLEMGFPFIKKLSFSRKDVLFRLKYPEEVKNYPLFYIKNYCLKNQIFISGYFSYLKILFFKVFYSFKKIVYLNKITTSGNHIIKLCKIPIYYKRAKTK